LNKYVLVKMIYTFQHKYGQEFKMDI
jgi:hypothetical protein